MIDETSKFFRERNFNVRYSEMDYHRVLKPSALLNFLQDLATFAADDGGFGYDEVSAKNLGWFLLKYHMEFNNYPENIENILLKTEARGCNKLFAIRDFEIYDNDTKYLLGRVTSQWALVNMTDKSMISPNKVFEFMPKIQNREDDLNFQKIQSLEKIDYSEDFKIRFDDIDVNQHVNNMNYIIWAFETLPKEFKDKCKLKTLDMYYKKEITYGNIVSSKVQLDDKIAVILLKNKFTDDDLCIIKAEFIEK